MFFRVGQHDGGVSLWVRPQGVGTGVSWKVPETWCPGVVLGGAEHNPRVCFWCSTSPLVSYGSFVVKTEKEWS